MEQTTAEHDPTGGWVTVIEKAIGWVELHPVAILVIALAGACWWMFKQWNKARAERDIFMKEMWRAKAHGHTFGSSKAEQTLMQYERRKRKR